MEIEDGDATSIGRQAQGEAEYGGFDRCPLVFPLRQQVIKREKKEYQKKKKD